MENTFTKLLKNQRKRFASVVSKYTVGEHRILRTEADSLLISFDAAVHFIEKNNDGQNIKDLSEKLNGTDAFIEQMYHTIASFNSGDYHSFLEDLCDQGDQTDLSEKITDDVVDEYFEARELHQMIIDFNLFGFVAEVRTPGRTDFQFDEQGNFRSCCVLQGITSSDYIFSETMEGLFKKAIEVADNHKKQSISSARKKKFKTSEA